MQNVLNRFFGAWSEADPAKQAQAVAASVSLQARYVDPRTAEPLIGPEAIAGYIAQFTEMAPGAQAQVVHVDQRDGITRATIAFVMPDGKRQMGQYFVTADDTGDLTHLVGFVGTGTDG